MKSMMFFLPNLPHSLLPSNPKTPLPFSILPLPMATFHLLLVLLPLTFTVAVHSKHTDTSNAPHPTSLYLSPKTLFSNYNKMFDSFKIFIYAPPRSFTRSTFFNNPAQSQFYASLLRSPFVTEDPSQAHLFFLPFPSSISTRNLARLVRAVRLGFPFWNRTLGADHFYLSVSGVGSSSDRNVVELKKNSIQISCFPTVSGLFIPHKDITLPPLNPSHRIGISTRNATAEFLGYMKLTEGNENSLSLMAEITGDPDFIVEPGLSSLMKSSKFCLFVYGAEMTWMTAAMASRCVPVVITDRPIQDLPLMDVMKWSEIAVFVRASGGAKGLKRALDGIERGRYEKMMESGAAATQHLTWNAEPQPHDAFHMIVYQLWLRRHTIRYARWVEQ